MIEATVFSRAAGLRSGDVKNTGKDERNLYSVAPVVGSTAELFMPKDASRFEFPMTLVDLNQWIEPIAAGESKSKSAEDDIEPSESLLQIADARIRQFMPHGAYLRVDMNSEHWLAFGIESRLPALVFSKDTLIALDDADVIARYSDLEQLHLSGLLWPEAAGRIAKTAYLTREPLGAGQIILFANDPVFRGYSVATQRLLLNSIFLGPGMGAKQYAPW
ncbi:MAG: hypothetical protein DRR42_10685 [Gammaproteobacteria bacterium]|nr:MAG: hypothetical protein DRR42_10685 [Gammaproteobacteria bacterium]